MQVFEVPEASRTARGRAVINLIQLQEKETVVKLLCTRGMDGKFLVLITKEGIIKRCDATEFAKIRATGIRAVTLKENDELVFCGLSTGNDNIVIATALGQGIRFKEEEVRTMGRQAAGVIGIRLRKKDAVVGMEIVNEGEDILVATEHGYGKKISVVDFRLAHRGGIGVRTIPTDNRNGNVIGLAVVEEHSNVLLIDHVGKIIRLSADEIRTMGRQAKGVRLIRLDENQLLAAIVAFAEPITDEHTESSVQSISDKIKLAAEENDNSMLLKNYDDAIAYE
jgi:DNA gyrase subunit A